MPSELKDSDLEDIKKGMEVKEFDWKMSEWQTKSLENMLDKYSIEEDGQVYRNKTDWIEDEKSPTGYVPTEDSQLEKFERTAEIDFYQIFLGEENDYWVEFRCTVLKGEVQGIEELSYKKEDNSERKKYQRQLEDSIKSAKPNWKIYKAYRYCLVLPLRSIRYIIGGIVKFSWKLERWMP